MNMKPNIIISTGFLVVIFSVATFSTQAHAFTIASIGDSFASGEGNPDKPQRFDELGVLIKDGPVWADQQCHRSHIAAPEKAAIAIAGFLDQPLEFIGLACTGARLDQGLLESYDPENTDDIDNPLPSQITALRDRIGDRPIDILLISAGGNDVGFADIIKKCIKMDSLALARKNNELCSRDPGVLAAIKNELAALPQKYDRLAGQLKTMQIRQVLITEYPDPTKGANGFYCGENGNSRILFLHPLTAKWAEHEIVIPLNAAVGAAAERHGWVRVPVQAWSTTHGYCAGDARWFRTQEDARNIQGPYELGFSLRDRLPPGFQFSMGTLHPNPAGHDGIARQIVATFLEAGRMFDRIFYLANNSDVQQAVGTSYEAVFEHWKNHGLPEGRRSSREFDVKFYLANYPDLQSLFRTNYRAALGHWVSHGLPAEGRKGSREFDAQFYLQAYPDLQERFGKNYAAAFDHWIKQGLPLEGRRGSREFDVRFYLTTYSDLQERFGENYSAALTHWILAGFAEGRLGVHTYHFRPLLFGDHRHHHFRPLLFQ